MPIHILDIQKGDQESTLISSSVQVGPPMDLKRTQGIIGGVGKQ